MASKDGGVATGFLIVVGIIIYPFILLYEWMGAFWFWTFMIIGASALVAWMCGAFKPKVNLPAEYQDDADPAYRSSDAGRPPRETQQTAGMMAVFEVDAAGGDMDMWVYWRDQADAAVRMRNPDQIRNYLQKMAYSMVGRTVTKAEKEDFRRFVVEFAKVDPLYHDVMAKIRVMVAEKPGLVQSQIYKGRPEEIVEQMRYVLYYAEVLGDLVRVKKGASYQLYLPEQREAFGLLPPIDPEIDFQEIYALHREATQYKDARDWDSAVVALQKAQTMMRSADNVFTIESWLRLPLFLQQGGRFDESIIEFERLLKETEDRCRREHPSDSHYAGGSPAHMRKKASKYQIEKINEKMALARSREEKRLAKLPKAIP